MILDACMSFKLLPSNLLHGVCLFRIGGIVIFLYNCVWRYAEVGNELIISDGKQKVCGHKGVDA
jgi:hypothetical protein